MSNFKLETCQREGMIEFLKDKEVEKCLDVDWNIVSWFYWDMDWEIAFKSPNIEEAIEYLPIDFDMDRRDWQYSFTIITWIDKNLTERAWDWNEYCTCVTFDWDTLIEALENMYIYLLDNNLLK